MPTHWETRAEPIAGYRLLERLGRGGFGEVWKAEAPGGLQKAIKFVYGDLLADPAQPSYVEQELKALSRIRGVRHPNVLSVERIDVVDGQLIIVMELADRNLEDRYRECQRQGLPGIPRKELLGYLWEAADALDVMNNEFGLQHLDIKPKNLFLIGGHVKVGDFGLVKDLEGVTAEVTGGVTPIYGAPETFDGWISRYTDQYSLAIVYQELYTGQRPFRGPSARQLMMQHVSAQPELDALPEIERDTVARALSKQPTHRYQSCREFVEALLRMDGPLAVGQAKDRPFVESPEADTSRTHVPEESATRLVSEIGDDEGLASRAQSGTTLLARVSTEPSKHGVLRPTLVIGIGEAGRSCITRIQSRIRDRMQCHASGPLLRLVMIDSEPAGAGASPSTDSATPCRSVFCPLDKPARLWGQWSKLTHLVSWVDPNCFMGISPTGGTNGYRRLGRLAFFQHFRSIADALSSELNELCSAATLEAAVAQSGAGLRSRSPKVILIAAMGGGCGSGMVIDLAYTVRQLLAQSAKGDFEIELILFVGINALDKQPELRRLNHAALADELAQLNDDASRVFTAHYEQAGEIHRFAGPPARAMYFFDRSANLQGAVHSTNAVDSAAELILQLAATQVGRSIDAMAAKESWPAFRSVGWFALTFPAERLLEQLANRLCRRLIDRWLSSLDADVAMGVRQKSETTLADSGFSPFDVANHLLTDWMERLKESIHVVACQPLVALEPLLAAVHGSAADDCVGGVVTQIKQLLGADPDEERDSPIQEPLLDRVSRASSGTVGRKLFPALFDALQHAMNQPGARLDAVKTTLEGFSLYLLRMVQQQEDLARTGQQWVTLRARAIRDQVSRLAQDAQTSDDAVRMLLNTLHQYVREKIEYRLRLQTVQVFLNLHGRLVEKSREISSVRQRLDEWRAAFSPAEASERTVSGVFAHEQMLFPDGSRSIEEAVEEFMHDQRPADLDALETTIQKATLSNVGGLWALCTGADRLEASMADALRAQVKRWLQPRLARHDAAELFFDRHKVDATARLAEMRTYHEWASPLTGAGLGASEVGCVVATPDSAAGRAFLETMRQVLPNAAFEKVVDRDRCVVGRICASAAPEQMLPCWIETSRAKLEQDVGAPMSPVFLRDVAAPRVREATENGEK